MRIVLFLKRMVILTIITTLSFILFFIVMLHLSLPVYLGHEIIGDYIYLYQKIRFSRAPYTVMGTADKPFISFAKTHKKVTSEQYFEFFSANKKFLDFYSEGNNLMIRLDKDTIYYIKDKACEEMVTDEDDIIILCNKKYPRPVQ